MSFNLKEIKDSFLIPNILQANEIPYFSAKIHLESMELIKNNLMNFFPGIANGRK
jgi:hypothetical protein